MDQRMSSSPLGNSVQKGAPGEAFHVLFSPPVASNGVHRESTEKQSSPLARSASKTPAPERAFTFSDYTPRKSGGFSPRTHGKGATATGVRETQTPPPPTMSLFDTGAFQKSAGMEKRAGAWEEAPGSSFPSNRNFAQPPNAMGALVEDYESNWVTVYGFNGNDLSLVLREFSKCGEIVDFTHGNDGPYVNWVYIAFDNKFGAQRALLRSGSQLSPTCMIGVKEVDEAKLAGLGGGDQRELVTEMLRDEPRERLQKQNKKLIAAGEEPVVPLESASVWDKFSEFVLGL